VRVRKKEGLRRLAGFIMQVKLPMGYFCQPSIDDDVSIKA
jgi:hypothetical protein